MSDESARASSFKTRGPWLLKLYIRALCWLGAHCRPGGRGCLAQASVWWYIAALAVAVAPVALVSGSATALATDASPLPSRITSAIIGFTQALLGAASPPRVGMLGMGARPMALVLLIAAILALAASTDHGRHANRPSCSVAEQPKVADPSRIGHFRYRRIV